MLNTLIGFALLSAPLIAPLASGPATAKPAADTVEAAADTVESQSAAETQSTPPSEAATEAAVPGQPAAAATPAPPAPPAPPVAPPVVAVAGGAVPVHAPRLGMEVSGASTGPDGSFVHTQARTWKQVIHEDPEVYAVYKRSKLLIPGIIFTGGAIAWGSMAIASSLDYGAPTNHTGRLVAYGAPIAGLAIGVPLLTVGIKNRMRLGQMRMEMTAAPVVTREGAMLGVAGRF